MSLSRKLSCWLVLAAITFGVAPRLKIFGQTNSFEVSANGVTKTIHSYKGFSPFSNAVLATVPALKLPEQGPWIISEADLKQPMGFTIDLAEHKKPIFSFLWNSLSKDTQSGLTRQYQHLMTPPGQIYTPGPELGALIADLNKLVLGGLIYNEKYFGRIDLSGDTLKLLEQNPVGENLARLNRLLLVDAFQLDIRPRPKILADPASGDFVFINFHEKTVSLYNPAGKKLWTADLSPTIETESANSPWGFREAFTPTPIFSVGIWDVSFRQDRLSVRIMGASTFGIDLKTALIAEEAHL